MNEAKEEKQLPNLNVFQMCVLELSNEYQGGVSHFKLHCLGQCFSNGVPWGSSEGSANFENRAKFEKKNLRLNIFSTFSLEIHVIKPMLLANLWTKAFKQ
jgi:hypothetical protein